jgi:hypothetical protein
VRKRSVEISIGYRYAADVEVLTEKEVRRAEVAGLIWVR